MLLLPPAAALDLADALMQALQGHTEHRKLIADIDGSFPETPTPSPDLHLHQVRNPENGGYRRRSEHTICERIGYTGVTGYPRCGHCSHTLPALGRAGRKYCSDRCRKRAQLRLPYTGHRKWTPTHPVDAPVVRYHCPQLP